MNAPVKILFPCLARSSTCLQLYHSLGTRSRCDTVSSFLDFPFEQREGEPWEPRQVESDGGRI